ncbi:MAG: hypothetical protein HY558_05150, partial [Euryarchaeota archaeon]|nr:hypothetical protein [Euryarchaeota archaeon]
MRDGQVIILSGFLVTVALVAITLILNDIIFVSNSSSIESIELSRSTYQDLHRLIREEAQWARNITRNNASNFTQHMKTFLYVLTKSYATQGVSVSATPSFNDTGVINNSDRVAYCCGSRGTCSDASYGVLPWMDSLGKIDNDSAQSALDYNYTDFGTCYDLLTNTSAWCQNASGERECHRSDFNVTIFESPDLDNTSLTPAMWSRLLNWTNKTWRGKERKFIQIGNGTVLDVLFHDTPDAYTMIGGTALNGWGNITAYVPTLTDSVGVVCTPEPAPGDAPTLLKWGVKSGDTVQFNTTGYIIYDNPLYTVDSL